MDVILITVCAIITICISCWRCAYWGGNWEKQVIPFVLYRHLRDEACSREWTRNNGPSNTVERIIICRQTCEEEEEVQICIAICRFLPKVFVQSNMFMSHSIVKLLCSVCSFSDGNATSVRRHCNRKLCTHNLCVCAYSGRASYVAAFA